MVCKISFMECHVLPTYIVIDEFKQVVMFTLISHTHACTLCFASKLTCTKNMRTLLAGVHNAKAEE